MGKDEAPLAQFYEKLSSEQKKSLSNAVTEKLQGIIGGYGELGVLVEYISVMLQSSRPKETIQAELEAFLQDESGPFTTWLCEKLAKMTESSSGKRRRKKDPKESKDAKEGTDAAARKAKKEKKAAAAAAATAAAAAAAAATAAPATAAQTERRSRSRKRRRRAAAAAPGAPAGAASATLTAADRKAKLTPNVDYMHEPRKDAAADATRWSFRAEAPRGGRPEAAPAPAGYMPPAYPPGPPAYPASRPPFTPAPHAPYAAPYPAPQHSPAQFFTPKKWKVARSNTVVRKTEKLDSDEVQKLQEGEIVEQVAPSFTTENGIVRVQIRHPSSPLFPKPIGWVTQDASAAGGPKFLEPGPEPMKTSGGGASGGSSWRPSGGSYWRPPRAPPPRPYGKNFQHITWTPS